MSPSKKLLVGVFSWIMLSGCSNGDGAKRAIEGKTLPRVFSEIVELDEKPTLIYFNSLACVNCRDMEALIEENNLFDEITKRYQFVTLYVDDRTVVDSVHWVKQDNKILKTVGAINSNFQTRHVLNGSQPFFLIRSKSHLVNDSVIGFVGKKEFETFAKFIRQIEN